MEVTLMKCVIVYFSGTGNSEYVAKKFKSEFEEHDIACDLIDISSNHNIISDYDYYVFGGPIHAESFPKNFTKWIQNNIKANSPKRVIIFSTQASKSGAGANSLALKLSKKGFKIDIVKPISMPNNYYTVMFRKSSEAEIKLLKENANAIVKDLVKRFINKELVIDSCSKLREISGGLVYKIFYQYSRGWARRTLTVDMHKCIQCRKCIERCPSSNIYLKDGEIKFINRCLSCQRCLNLCPVNAYKYKNKKVEQYRVC